jgi:predicted O-methyltransferase YrrM
MSRARRFFTSARRWTNVPLAKLNLRLETLTAPKAEARRVRKLVDGGHFEKPVFPLLDSFSAFDATPILQADAAFGADCRRLLAPGAGSTRYDPANEYFYPADGCLAYLIARACKPRLWLEVGSGNSTRVVRQAIDDGKLPTKLVCIDPQPRIDITGVAHDFIRSEVEAVEASRLVDQLAANDVLFIDSSHSLKVGNDVCHLLLNVVPRLRPGVLVHIHDIFLPYDYPREWVERGWAWSEQYLVQAMLQFGLKLQVVWPGYYVQTSRPDIGSRLDFLGHGRAQSLWLRAC